MNCSPHISITPLIHFFLQVVFVNFCGCCHVDIARSSSQIACSENGSCYANLTCTKVKQNCFWDTPSVMMMLSLIFIVRSCPKYMPLCFVWAKVVIVVALITLPSLQAKLIELVSFSGSQKSVGHSATTNWHPFFGWCTESVDRRYETLYGLAGERWNWNYGERVVTSKPRRALLSTPKLTTQSQNAKVTTTYKQYIFVLKTMVVFFEIL